jgi:Sec-independent protein translocase protein TatA
MKAGDLFGIPLKIAIIAVVIIAVVIIALFGSKKLPH